MAPNNGAPVKAGVAIDVWKYPIFERHLRQAGYPFELAAGLTEDTMSLIVTTTNLTALQEVLMAASTEAAMTGAPK